MCRHIQTFLLMNRLNINTLPLKYAVLAVFLPFFCIVNLFAGELLLHWHFEAGNEKIEKDASGHGHTAIMLRGEYNLPYPERVSKGPADEDTGSLRLTKSSSVESLKPIEIPESWTLSFWIKDERSEEKIPGKIELDKLISIKTQLLGLSEPWYFRTDPDNVGRDKGWQKNENDNGWEHIQVPAFLSETNVGSYLGYGWYKTRFFVPDEFVDMEHELRIEGVDEQAWVYVNGKLAGEQTEESTGKKSAELWDKPFSVTLGPEHLRSEQKNLLVIRCYAGSANAGLFRPVYFIPPEEKTQKLDISELNGKRVTPGNWEHIALTFEPGKVYLYVNGVLDRVDDTFQMAHKEYPVKLEFKQRGEHFLGLLNDVRLFDAALSKERVEELSNNIYHPDARWLEDFDDPMRELIKTGMLTRSRAEHMASLGAPSTSDLVQTLETSEHPDERVDAIWALVLISEDDALNVLAEMLDAEEDLAEAVAEGLLHLYDANAVASIVGKESTTELLGRILRKAPQVEQKKAAASALALIADEAAVKELRSAMEAPSLMLRFTAKRALRKADLDASRPGESPELLKNPYADINWDGIKQYKANFHCHTIKSDGRAEPRELIYNYANAGYDILAITDHDNLDYHITREGQRRIVPTAETTWPWTNWIDEEPSLVWEYKGEETAAFFPELGNRGMLAVRGNELSTHPHIVSLFNNCGFPVHGGQTDNERLSCVEEKGGISYYAHPSLYVPGGSWENHVANGSWDWNEAVEYFGNHITKYDSNLGIEMRPCSGSRRLRKEEKLWDRLLKEYYPVYDIFIKGSDDSHDTRVPDNATITIVLARELTEESIRHALESGHTFVGGRTDIHPQFNEISVDEKANIISLDIQNHDRVVWIKNGRKYQEGDSIDYSELELAILRFVVEIEDVKFYSQAFYIY